MNHRPCPALYLRPLVVLLALAAALLPISAQAADPGGTGGAARAVRQCDPLSAPDSAACPPDLPAGPDDPQAPERPHGYTGLGNPAVGQTLARSADDPLEAISGRPLDTYIIPEGGGYLDPLHDGPHYGVDYANPADYLNGQVTYFHPIAAGYVTARASCLDCFADGDAQGRVGWKWPRYNFGWGGLVLVETPYTANVSLYILYAHLARDFVSLGDYVTPDDLIGVVGTTGYSQEFHLHMEIRYGTPGRFWNADFSQYATLDRWLATMFVNPAWLIYPENHSLMVEALAEWSAQLPTPNEIP